MAFNNAITRSLTTRISQIHNTFSSLPIASDATTARAHLAQTQIAKHQLQFKAPSSSQSGFIYLKPVNPTFSTFSATAAYTSPLLVKNSKSRQFAMAATSIIFPKEYSTTAVPAQVDVEDESVDPVQRQLLEEQCIVLNDKDHVIGHDTKRNCHKVVNGDVLLHRAFSVFLFNGKGELLLQQRSKTKITFPMMWTNTCCSHPLYTPSELEEEQSAIGVRRAARRRLEIELGIPQSSISLDDFVYLTRIHYKALSNSVWGEHEIDYILFLQKDDLEISQNCNEINEIRWVTLDKVKEMATSENVTLTPWFELILKTKLPQWWTNLEGLKKFEDHDKIHRM